MFSQTSCRKVRHLTKLSIMMLTFSMPVIVGENQVVSGGGSFNGYIVDVNYFE